MVERFQNYSTTEKIPNQDSLIIFFPGMMGGGRNLTQLRLAFPDIFIPSSVTTIQSTRPKRKSSYEALVNEIIQRKPRKLTVLGHSFGVIELFDFLRNLSQNFDGKPIDIENFSIFLISPPGLGEKGVIGLLKLGQKVARLLINVSLYEQHSLYPLPEIFYLDKQLPKNGYIVLSDTQESRKKRKEWFEKNICFLAPKNARTILDQLSQIDELISDKNLSSTKKQRLLKKRAKILAPWLQMIFRGDHIDEKIHEEVLSIYQELFTIEVKNLLFYIANLIIYLSRFFSFLAKGSLRKKLSSIIDYQNITNKITITIVSPEFDPIFGPLDIQKINPNELEPIIVYSAVLENLAHSSIGYNPDVLRKILGMDEND